MINDDIRTNNKLERKLKTVEKDNKNLRRSIDKKVKNTSDFIDHFSKQVQYPNQKRIMSSKKLE